MRKIYIFIIAIISLFSLVLYSTYAMFTQDVNIGEFVNLTAASIPLDSSVLEFERITLSGYEEKKIDLNITNSTSNSLYYGVWYEMVDPDSINSNITVAKYASSANPIIGQLTSSQTKTVTLYLVNDTADDVIVNIGVGYSDTNSLNLPTNRHIITDEASEPIDMSNAPALVSNFDYTGSVQTYNVTEAGSYKLEVWGAQGGSGYTYSTGGGKGGYSYGTVTLNQGDTLYVYTGGQGSASADASTTRSGAGFNANAANVTDAATGANSAGGGGGASDIRIGTDDINYRVIVAGGGGGKCGQATESYCAGGVGGGTTGGAGIYQVSTTGNTTYAGQGGTQTAGGARGTYTSYGAGQAGGFGYGGYGGVRRASTSYRAAGAGGGGWYGGGGGAYRYGGGGGGSGYVWTSATASSKPSSYALATSYQMTDAATVAGSSSFNSPDGTSETGHSGNGYARITHLVTYPTLSGLTDLYVDTGNGADLLSGVTCVDNGTGCTIVKTSITDTSTLTGGWHVIKYIVKNNSGVKYSYDRKVYVADIAANTIISLSKGDSWESGASGVYQTNGHEYRYIGANVNNWVRFNDDDYRIIGVFDENSHGVTGKMLIKVIMANQLGSYSWGVTNSASAYTTYSTYNNNWETANANILLNEYFLNATNTSATYGSCSDWTYHSNDNNYKTKDCSNIIGYGIKTETLRNYIQPVTWYLKGYDSFNYSKQNIYTCERSDNTTIENCNSGNSGTYPTKVENKSIGLMYASDYIYASGYYSSEDTSINDSTYFTGNKNWLYIGDENTISPSIYKEDFISRTYNSNMISGISYGSSIIRPVFYLKSTIKIKSGDGTYDNPFIIG